MGVTGLSSTEEPIEGGEHDGEHTLGSCWALFTLDAKLVGVATKLCGGLLDEEERIIGATCRLFPVPVVGRAIVLTTVEPTWIGVEVEVVVEAEVNGLMAMIFFPPEPVINTSCFPVAWSDAANAGGTWKNKY